MLTAALALLVGALGQPGAAAAERSGLLRVAHLSPDTPAVDVAVAPLPAGARNGPLADPGPDLATGLAYGALSPFARLAPGSYAVSVRAAGSARTTPPVLSVRVEVPAGGARTVAVSGRFADLSLRVLPDDLSSPGAGSARVRVIAGAGTAGPLDASLGGPDGHATGLASGLRFPGAAPSVVVPAGPGTVTIGSGTSSRRLPVHLAGGSVVDVVVLDSPHGGLTVRPVVAASGPSIVPRGPVDAGGGGTAGPSVVLLAAGIAACAALAACGARGRRRLLPVAAAALALAGAQPAAAGGPAAPAPPAIPARVVLDAGVPAPGVLPSRVRVPSAGVDTALVPIGLDRGGALTPPADPTVAGWFASGPAPGDVGPAVLAGHVDSTAGPGAFFPIGRVAVGDPVLVTRADGTTLRFTVTRVAHYAKTAFPTAEVYGPTPGAELRLITCGGRFDRARRSYVDDVVVFARLGLR